MTLEDRPFGPLISNSQRPQEENEVPITQSNQRENPTENNNMTGKTHLSRCNTGDSLFLETSLLEEEEERKEEVVDQREEEVKEEVLTQVPEATQSLRLETPTQLLEEAPKQVQSYEVNQLQPGEEQKHSGIDNFTVPNPSKPNDSAIQGNIEEAVLRELEALRGRQDLERIQKMKIEGRNKTIEYLEEAMTLVRNAQDVRPTEKCNTGVGSRGYGEVQDWISKP